LRASFSDEWQENWRTCKGNGALSSAATEDARRHWIEKLNERIWGVMQNQLAEFKLGRIVLHLLCFYRNKNFAWHWRGIVREFSQGALFVSPTSKCDATERWFHN
jgi:hypothetical protein